MRRVIVALCCSLAAASTVSTPSLPQKEAQQRCLADVKRCDADAQSGDANAQYGLGLLYARGEGGLQQSFKHVAALWKRAAKQDHVHAMRDLGVLYHQGRGVEADAGDAARWFRKAADVGDAAAQYTLAVLHGKGKGAERSLEKASAWLRKAAAQGHDAACRDLGVLLEQRGDMAGAIAQYRTAAEAPPDGDDYAQYRLAMIYEDGRGVKRDYAKAAQWHLKAAENGNAMAQYSLGFLYQEGEGVARNLTASKRWFHFAALQKHAGAQYSLAFRYLRGEGTAKNSTAAAHWFGAAAQQGHGAAQFSVALRYELGDGVEQNFAVARRWFVEATGSPSMAASAALALGKMAMCGRATKVDGPDYEAATSWLEKCRSFKKPSKECGYWLAGITWAAPVAGAAASPFPCHF